MDASELWKRYQDWLYYHEELGIFVDVSRMRFDDGFVEAIQPKFNHAFAMIKELEAGAIVNPDENRMVGHYWLRDAALAPTVELQTEITKVLAHIKAFAADVHSGKIHPPNAPKFTDVISIGIGGSALGPEFVDQALAPLNPPMQVHFLDNTDPAGIDRTLDQIQDRFATTLVLTISKSGGTPETRNGMLETKHRFEAQGLKFANHAVAITGYDSKLAQIAESEGWVAQFPMHDWVGGRTSELSAVGLVPAALQGIPIQEMLDGAKAMDAVTRVPDLKANPAALLALSWYFAGNGKGEKDMVVLPYKDSLLLFSRYLQQLVMESLGKELDLDGQVVHQGIAVYGNKGSTDQHAYVQQLRDGLLNFFVTFIEVLKDREGPSIDVEPGVTSGDYLSGLMMGTRQALYDNLRDSITVTLPEVTPTHVGALIALYERTVSLYGFLVNVNAYHQPGVEAGKKAAAANLALQNAIVKVLEGAVGPLSLQTVAEQAGAVEQIETVYKILRHLSVNNRVKLAGNLGQPASLEVSLG
jgi:glucose-6-phosphate isomerase